jgi:hypothetical protein
MRGRYFEMKLKVIFTIIQQPAVKTILLLALVLLATAASGQQAPPIQDNSFLIEEAYNQEAGVVQHISTFTRFWASKDWVYTFTQEWPVPGHERHQLSYTVSADDPGGPGGGAGIGDTYLNYRYQLVGNGESRTAIAPRISLLAPSGNSRYGRGVGGTGVQMALPISVVIGRRFVTHMNVGTTLVPHARNAAGATAFTRSVSAGQSLIWLVKPRFNVLLEAVWNRGQAVAGADRTLSSDTVLLNPAIRWAHRFKNGLEIVPGVGMPIGVGPSAGERGLLLYLSFEHPLWRESK